MHENSLMLCRQFVAGLKIHATGPLSIADVGSADINGTYRPLFDHPGWTYTGFDIQVTRNVDVVLHSAEDWRLPAQYKSAFDLVVCGQVMEHCAAPWRFIHDVVSLMNPGGLLWLAVPNTEKFHEYPIDAWRVWPAGMKAIFEEGNLEILSCTAEGPDTIGIARKPCAGT